MAQVKLDNVRARMSELEQRLLDDAMDAMLEQFGTESAQRVHSFPGDDRLAFVEEVIGNYIIEARTF